MISIRRKSVLLSMLLLSYLPLVGCGNDTTINQEALVFQNRESGEIISLGMTREEVEEQLRLHSPSMQLTNDERNDGTNVVYGETPENELTVRYADGVVVEALVDEDAAGSTEASNWCLADGITKNSTMEEIAAVYGDAELQKEDGSQLGFLWYYYDDAGKRVEGPEDAVCEVVFGIGDSGLALYSISSFDGMIEATET